MKTFKQYIEEQTPDETFKKLQNSGQYIESGWSDHGGDDGHYEDWCKRNPDHKDCEEWRKKQKGGKK